MNNLKEANDTTASRGKLKVRTGTVVSTKMQKTVVVAVARRKRHPVYGKYITVTKRYLAHDEENNCHSGDTVEIVESRPLSKNKSWRVQKVVARAAIDRLKEAQVVEETTKID